MTVILRIKTSRTLKAIDGWKQRFDLRNHRFLALMSILILAASCSSEIFLLSLIIVGFSIHYAAMQFAVLVMLGALSVKLSMYRFSNILLRGLRLGGSVVP